MYVLNEPSLFEQLDVAHGVVIPVLFAPLDMVFGVAYLALSVLLAVMLVMIGPSLSALLAAALVMMILMVSVEAKRECPAANSLSHTSMAYVLFPRWKTLDYLFYRGVLSLIR